jgi:hypothetical protein
MYTILKIVVGPEVTKVPASQHLSRSCVSHLYFGGFIRCSGVCWVGLIYRLESLGVSLLLFFSQKSSAFLLWFLHISTLSNKFFRCQRSCGFGLVPGSKAHEMQERADENITEVPEGGRCAQSGTNNFVPEKCGGTCLSKRNRSASFIMWRYRWCIYP